MSFLEDLLSEASGGKARLLSGEDAVNFLSGLFDRDKPKQEGLPESLLRATNCGLPNCPIHGHLNEVEEDAKPDGRISEEALNLLSSDDAWEHVIEATAGAHNALMGNRVSKAVVLQTQAMLWERIAARLLDAEVTESLKADEAKAEQPDAQVAGYVGPQDNLDLDKPLITNPEGE